MRRLLQAHTELLQAQVAQSTHDRHLQGLLERSHACRRCVRCVVAALFDTNVSPRLLRGRALWRGSQASCAWQTIRLAPSFSPRRACTNDGRRALQISHSGRRRRRRPFGHCVTRGRFLSSLGWLARSQTTVECQVKETSQPSHFPARAPDRPLLDDFMQRAGVASRRARACCFEKEK